MQSETEAWRPVGPAELLVELLGGKLELSCWQPIETAPKDGSSVVLWAEYMRPIQCEWNDQEKLWDCGRLKWSEGHGCGPTHWTPMPRPPAAALPEVDKRRP